MTKNCVFGKLQFDKLFWRVNIKNMPVYLARKINMAFSKDRGIWNNVETMNFTIISEKSRSNLASHPQHIIPKTMQSFNVLSGIHRNAQNSNLVSMSLIGKFDGWDELGMFDIEG